MLYQSVNIDCVLVSAACNDNHQKVMSLDLRQALQSCEARRTSSTSMPGEPRTAVIGCDLSRSTAARIGHRRQLELL